jgi:hypothetical protein
MTPNHPSNETERELETIVLQAAIRWAGEGCPMEGQHYQQLKSAAHDLYWLRRRGK